MSYSPGEDLHICSHLTEGGGQTLAVRSQSINILNSLWGGGLCVCLCIRVLFP